MTFRDSGVAVPTSATADATPFGIFVMDGGGPLAGEVLAGFFHALNNLMTVANGYATLARSDQLDGVPLNALRDEAIQAGERVGALSKALQALALSRPATDGLEPAFVDDLLSTLEPLLSAVSGWQIPVLVAVGARMGPVMLAPTQFIRAVTGCIAGAPRLAAAGSLEITLREGQGSDPEAGSGALLRIAQIAPLAEDCGDWEWPVEELAGLVLSWNGEVSQERTPGAYRELRIFLPYCDGHRTPIHDGLEFAGSERADWRVLLVEEDPAELRTLESGLLDAGLAVASFTRGSTALDSIRGDSHHYNLVITDILGADLTGLELARLLQLETPCTHVVFSAPAERIAQARMSTRNTVLAKPFDIAEVLETVDTLRGQTRPRILVADDEEAIRALVRQCLSEEKYEIMEAEDGLQACELLQQHEVQLLIVDLVMPAYEGLETIRSICRRGHRLKILAISGQRPEYLRAAGLLGADEVLRKPFSPSDLRAAVERLLKAALSPA